MNSTGTNKGGSTSGPFPHSAGDVSPGASPVSVGPHGIFPFPSLGGGATSTWTSKASGHPTLPALTPPSAMAVRVASAVSEVQDWWRDQVMSADGSEDESH